jgi:arsenate reductase
VSSREATGYIVVQVAGACVGAMVANLMFDLPAVEWSTKVRDGSGLSTSEVVATLGLLLVIFGVVRSGRALLAPFIVGAYITGAYWFTSSTSFANPAVTLARTLSDTFAGIAPESVPLFLLAQGVGLAIALVIIRVLYPDASAVADELLMPHEGTP